MCGTGDGTAGGGGGGGYIWSDDESWGDNVGEPGLELLLDTLEPRFRKLGGSAAASSADESTAVSSGCAPSVTSKAGGTVLVLTEDTFCAGTCAAATAAVLGLLFATGLSGLPSLLLLLLVLTVSLSIGFLPRGFGTFALLVLISSSESILSDACRISLGCILAAGVTHGGGTSTSFCNHGW